MNALKYGYCYSVAATASKAYGVRQAHGSSREHRKSEKEQQKLNGTSVLETAVFLVPTAVEFYNDTRTHTHAHEPTR